MTVKINAASSRSARTSRGRTLVIDPVRGVRHQHLGMTTRTSPGAMSPLANTALCLGASPPPDAFLTTSEGCNSNPRMVHHVRKFASVGSSDAVSSTSALAFAAWAIAGRFGSVLRVS